MTLKLYVLAEYNSQNADVSFQKDNEDMVDDETGVPNFGESLTYHYGFLQQAFNQLAD